MTFHLVDFTPFAVVVFVLAAVAALLSVGVVAEFFVRNHSVRTARRESIPTYYRGLVGAH